MSRNIPGPYPEAEMRRFLDTFLYREDAFLVDEVVSMDAKTRAMEARLDTTRPLPFAAQQRVDANHPAHVSGPELLMVTGSLGCMHAWFFHGCRWDEGWAGFGNRVHRADFRQLALIGPPLRLVVPGDEDAGRSTPGGDPLRVPLLAGRRAGLPRRSDGDVRQGEAAVGPPPSPDPAANCPVHRRKSSRKRSGLPSPP